MSNDPIGDAPDLAPAFVALSLEPDHDQVGIDLVGLFEDLFPRLTVANGTAPADANVVRTIGSVYSHLAAYGSGKNGCARTISNAAGTPA